MDLCVCRVGSAQQRAVPALGVMPVLGTGVLGAASSFMLPAWGIMAVAEGCGSGPDLQPCTGTAPSRMGELGCSARLQSPWLGQPFGFQPYFAGELQPSVY